jgi:hypothetical protein
VAHGSFFPIIDKFCGYTIQVMKKMELENIKSITPNAQRTKNFCAMQIIFSKVLCGLDHAHPGSRVARKMENQLCGQAQGCTS